MMGKYAYQVLANQTDAKKKKTKKKLPSSLRGSERIGMNACSHYRELKVTELFGVNYMYIIHKTV